MIAMRNQESINQTNKQADAHIKSRLKSETRPPLRRASGGQRSGAMGAGSQNYLPPLPARVCGARRGTEGTNCPFIMPGLSPPGSAVRRRTERGGGGPSPVTKLRGRLRLGFPEKNGNQTSAAVGGDIFLSPLTKRK